MTPYNELLKDIRWLKKKNKILKRDNYTCTVCKCHSNLQVHHTYYLKSHPPPWAYPDESLLTVCNDCHIKYHKEHEHTITDKQLSYKPKHKKKDNRKKGRTNIKQDRINKKKEKPRSLAQKVEDLKKERERKKKYITIKGKEYKI
jgi:hypothetical protein